MREREEENNKGKWLFQVLIYFSISIVMNMEATAHNAGSILLALSSLAYVMYLTRSNVFFALIE